MFPFNTPHVPITSLEKLIWEGKGRDVVVVVLVGFRLIRWSGNCRATDGNSVYRTRAHALVSLTSALLYLHPYQ